MLMLPQAKVTTPRDLQELIGAREFIRLEFKQSQLFYDWKTGLPKKGEYQDVLTREVTALANTEGGQIVIGVETERSEGEPERAIRLDKGIAFQDFSPETIQRAVESAISPPLPGLRFVPITTAADHRRYYLVIEVPKGSTAHQARDRIYYGRSEFETIRLHDSVVRLLMTRKMEPHAVVRLDHLTVKDREFSFGVYVENDGEIDIREFKVSLRVYVQDYRIWATPDRFDQSSDDLFAGGVTLAFRDGWPAPDGSAAHKKSKSSPKKDGKPLLCVIFPQDRFFLSRYGFTLRALRKGIDYEDHVADTLRTFEETMRVNDTDPTRAAEVLAQLREIADKDPSREGIFVLHWRIFLPNTRPIEGTIDLSKCFGRFSEQEDAAQELILPLQSQPSSTSSTTNPGE